MRSAAPRCPDDLVPVLPVELVGGSGTVRGAIKGSLRHYLLRDTTPSLLMIVVSQVRAVMMAAANATVVVRVNTNVD